MRRREAHAWIRRAREWVDALNRRVLLGLGADWKDPQLHVSDPCAGRLAALPMDWERMVEGDDALRAAMLDANDALCAAWQAAQQRVQEQQRAANAERDARRQRQREEMQR